MIRVADYIAEYLENKGVRAVFLLSGGGIMHLIDAVGRRKKLKYFCNHHEQSCALAAGGYARQTGGLGICYATSGPGATNTVTGIVECWQDSIPVLFITGQSKLSQTIQGSKLPGLRQFGTFEVDIVPIVKSITKYAVFLDDPKTVRYHLEKACALAISGRPGPVLIDIPVDIQGTQVDPESLAGYNEHPYIETPPNDKTIDRLLDRLQHAERPLILVGHGVRCAGMVEKFRSVLKSLNVPAVTTQQAVDLIEHDDALYVGHPGMKGDRPGNFAVQSADVILTLGCSLHVLTTGYELDRFAPKAYKVQVDLDEWILKREQVGVDEKIHCSVQAFLDKLSAILSRRNASGRVLVPPQEWHERCLLWKKYLAVINEPHQHPENKINYYDLIDSLSDLCGIGETIVTDAGIAFYVVGQAFRIKRGQRVLISGALGAMGHALPTAIGAAIAAPDARIVAVTGDGSLQASIHDLAAVHHAKLNLKLFVLNSDGYTSIRNTQNNFFGGFQVGTDSRSGVWFPPLEKIAAAYDIPYIPAKERTELQTAVQRALDAKGPVICEIFTAATQEVLPMVSSMKHEDGTMESKPLHDMYPFMDRKCLDLYLSGDIEKTR